MGEFRRVVSSLPHKSIAEHKSAHEKHAKDRSDQACEIEGPTASNDVDENAETESANAAGDK